MSSQVARRFAWSHQLVGSCFYEHNSPVSCLRFNVLSFCFVFKAENLLLDANLNIKLAGELGLPDGHNRYIIHIY